MRRFPAFSQASGRHQMEAGFFWLLTEQRDAKNWIKQARALEAKKNTQQGSTPTGLAEPPSPNSRPAEAQPTDNEQNPQYVAGGTAAAVVLHALACSVADVPAFLERRGFSDQASGEGLVGACNDALLAVLCCPCGPLYPATWSSPVPCLAGIGQNGGQHNGEPTSHLAADLGRRGSGSAVGSDLSYNDEPPAGPAPAPAPAETGDDTIDEEANEDEEGKQAAGAASNPTATGGTRDFAGSTLYVAEQAAGAVAVHGVTALLTRLLELGADANHVRQHDSMTPLAAALSGGHTQAAALLLDAGAHPDPPTPASMPAALASNAPATAAAVVAPGPRDKAEVNGNRAAKRKREETPTQAPEAAGGCGGQSGGNQPTPLVLAVASGCTQLIDRLLAAGADPNRACSMRLVGSQSRVALTPLIAAINAGNAALVTRLLAAGADLHLKCTTGPGSDGPDWTSALSAAVLGGRRDMVELLVAAGACAGRRGGTCVGKDHPGLRAVVLAARRGRTDLLQLLYPRLAKALQGGTSAMLGSLKRRTALHPLAAAAERGQVGAVELLLQLGAPPGHDGSVVAGVLQYTPLMLAAANGHLPVLQRLLAAGACPLRTNSRDQTAAALALQHGQLAAVGLLLRHTGEVEGELAEEQLGGTDAAGEPRQSEGAVEEARAVAAGQPAHAALEVRPQLRSASKAWQLGFAAGMLPRQRPLTLIALEQERQRYQLLLLVLLEAHGATVGAASEAAARVRQLAGPASLAHAAAGSEALLDTLLACGASLGCVDPTDGSFPLLAACYHGWEPMLRLLRRGADVNQADSGGSTALMLMAARPSMLDTARQLLSWHAHLPREDQRLDLLRRNAEGRDAVGVAIAAKNRRFAEELLANLMARQQAEATAAGAGAGGGATGEAGGRTAAGAAAVVGGVGAAGASGQQEQEAGANSSAISGAAGAAASRAYDLLAELGASCIADINKPGKDGQHLLLSQVKTASRKQLRQLLTLPGLDLNVREASGRTPLMLAVGRQQAALVQDLLSTARADVNARDNRGCTAALLAARAGNACVLRVLRDAGADLGCADNEGVTPLMALAAAGQHKLLTELLRGQQPPPVNAQDHRGWTALHHAAAAGSFNACKALRSWGADVALCCVEGRQTALDLAKQAGHMQCLSLLQPPVAPVEQQAQA